MALARERVIEAAKAAGTVDDDALARAAERRARYAELGVDVALEDLLAEEGRLPPGLHEESTRGEDLPSRLAELDVVGLAGGSLERPVFLARREHDGETFLVHACMRSRRDAPAEVDAFVRAVEQARRLSGPAWSPVRRDSLVDGAYAAASAVPDGSRLDEWLERRRLSIADAVALVRRLAEALRPLEALGASAAFPEASLVFVSPDLEPTLVAVEVLLADRGRPGDAAEVARSAARCLARILGPERLHDGAVRDLHADLSSGRLDAIRPRTAPRIALDALETGAGDGATTPTRLAPLAGTAARASATASPPVAALPARSRRGWIVAGVALAALAGIGFFVWRSRAGPERAADPDAVPPAATSAEVPAAAAVAKPSVKPATDAAALAALDAALEFLAAHRDDQPQAAIDRFRSVETRFLGTDAAARATERRRQLESDVEAEGDRRAGAVAADVERLLASDDVAGASAAIGRFPAALSFTSGGARVDALRARVGRQAESLYLASRDAIDAGAEPGGEDAARAAFERVRALGDPEIAARAKRRLDEALARATWVRSRRDALAAELERMVGESLVAAGDGAADRATRLVEAAKRGPLGQAWKDRVASAEAAVARVGETYVLAGGEAKTRVGKPLSVRTRELGAKPFPVTLVEVAGDRLAYTRGGAPAALRLSALDPEVLAGLALASGRENEGRAVLAAATLYLATGRFATAQLLRDRAASLGATAPAFDDELAAVRASLLAAATTEIAAGDADAPRDRAAARAEYERAASLAPFLPTPLLRLGENALADGRLEDAYASFTRAKALGAGGPDLLHGIARSSASRGDDEALAAWRTFLASVPPSDPRVDAARTETERLFTRVTRGRTSERVKAARALLDAGRAADAVAALEDAVRADPGSLDARRALAHAAEKADDAVAAYVSWRDVAETATQTRDVAEARDALARLDRVFGERPAEIALRRSAEDAASKSDLPAAVDSFRRAVAASPLDVAARLGLGATLAALGARTGSTPTLDDGVAAFDVAVAIAPVDARAWAGRAEVRRWKGDLEGAIADATSAIDRQRGLVSAWNTRGLAHYSRLEFEAAIADLTVVATLAPLLAVPRISRAGVYLAASRYAEAEADLEAALTRGPSAAERAQIDAMRTQIAARRQADRR